MTPTCALDITGDENITGKIGINTTPTCALDVTGDGKITGKLGINMTPTCALDVTGDGKISGNFTTNNLTVNGSFSLNNITTGNITNSGDIFTNTFSATGTIAGGNINTGGNVTATGYLKGSNLQFQSNITLGYSELVSLDYTTLRQPTYKMYYSTLNATCYFTPCPLVIKDCYTNASTDFHLSLPCPETLYLDLTNNEITITLPYVNQFIGNVDVSKQIFCFRIRQMMTGAGNYWHLKTHTHNNPNIIPPGAVGGTIYDFQNRSQGSYYTPGAWYMEIHYYKGNWYSNRIS